MIGRLVALGVMVSLVLAIAGCGQDAEPLNVATSPAIDLVGTEMAYTPSEIAVNRGLVEVSLRNEGAVVHDVRIQNQRFLIEARPGETATGAVELVAGRYEVYCSLPGHREAGMHAELEVR